MREHTINLYKFDELSAEAQQKAIQEWRDGIEWSIESDFISEDFHQQLSDLGYPTEDVEWRLNYSQGDGVAFYGEVDLSVVAPRLLNGKILSLYNRIVDNDLTITANIYRNSFGHHYSHHNTMEVELDGDDIDTIMDCLYEDLDSDSYEYENEYNELEAFLNVFGEWIKSDIQSTSRELEKCGYEQIKHVESDENIIEVIKSNEYEFTKEGLMH